MAAKKAASKKPKGAKGAKKGAAAPGIAVVNHPRARHQINVLKSYAGLGAFGVVAYLAWKDGLPFLEVATRSLMWGIAAYVVVWALAVQVWRQVAVAEIRAAERRWREHKAQQEEQVQKLRQALDENGLPIDGTGAMPV
jgi:hypothetical protein